MKYCIDCTFSDFRLSHVRGKDIPKMFLLRWPVRCRKCGRRAHGSMLFALKLLFSGHSHGHPEGHTPH